METLSNQQPLQATDEDITKTDLFHYWGVKDCIILGYYHYDTENNIGMVTDIRKPNFAEIPYYPEDKSKASIKIQLQSAINGIESDNYYLFNWKLSNRNITNPYEICIDFDFPPQSIQPKWFIDQLFEDRYNDTSKNFESSTNFLETLSKQLSAKESTFIYELLQNANDYPQVGEAVDVEFYITHDYLLFLHSGDYFNVRNISGICGINEKEKVANKKTIGYKGIGFKTVFLNNNYVFIETGDYLFRFDKKAKKIKRLEAPWAILPIWTPREEVPEEIASVFDAAETKYRVKIALRPDNPAILHEGRQNYESLFKEIFADSNIILFIPNIRSVKVFIGHEMVRDCIKDKDKWLIESYESNIDSDFQALVNKDIDTGKSRIPEKYKDFDRTKVSFACKKEGRMLLPIEDAKLYCYLPTSVSWGFPFLLNTDMIPKGDRDNIEREVYLKDENETNFNMELARIAGEKFCCWIQDLVKNNKYDYDSIFRLIPDFNECIERHGDYKDFIEKFQEGFERTMTEAEIIPVVEHKQVVLKRIDNVIYDTTGLSCAGIMTDEDILSFSNLEDVFPHPLLRDHEKMEMKPGIKKFLNRYHSERQKYDIDRLRKEVIKADFQKWLEAIENNTKFLRFLLQKELIAKFNKSPIFIAEQGGLHKPEDLYYSVDKYYSDIAALDMYLNRLSLQTRADCEPFSQWDDFMSNFKQFEPNDFVNKVLLQQNNKSKVQGILSEPKTSAAFMHFLSRNVLFEECYKDFPFVEANGSIIQKFTTRPFVFAPSAGAEAIQKKSWIDESWIGIVSSVYDEVTLQYFIDHFGVKEYEDSIIVNNIVCNRQYPYRYYINNKISNYEISQMFVDFAFKNCDEIADGALSGYKLSIVDKNGAETLASRDQHSIYLRNKIYNNIEEQNWVDCAWMYALKEAYYHQSSRCEEYKNFFTAKFGIPMPNQEMLFKDIIQKYSLYINGKLADRDNNIAFWRWAKDFVKEISTTEDFTIFKLLVKELDNETYQFTNTKNNDIYLSNAYQAASAGIETIVKKYAPNALFVASEYIENNTTSTIQSWVEFLKKIEVKTTIEELIFSKIIPNVGDIKEEGLPNLLGQYYDEIQERWEYVLGNGKTVKENLQTIHVKTKDGAITPLKQSILIDMAKEKEPFADITLDKELADPIASDWNAKKLLLEIGHETECGIINNVTTWQERKLDAYAAHEDRYSIDTHIAFMRELAHIDIETLKTFKCIEKLRLLDTEDNYQKPTKLTLSSRYKTSCLFDKYGATEGLNFVSERYVAIDEKSFVEIAKHVLHLRYRFGIENIRLLENFDFAVYFWMDYAPKHLEFVLGMIEKDFLKYQNCVPTQAGNVCTPQDVYSMEIAKEYVIKKIPNWEYKVISDKIPITENTNKQLIEKLGLKKELSFEDGLTALDTIRGRDKRHTILEWMAAEYNDTDRKLIDAYRQREESKWQNGKTEYRQITELYALAPEPESKNLKEFFRDNEYVLQEEYISPGNANTYRDICRMMQIPIIEEKDMVFNPIGTEENIKPYLEGRLLLVAGIEDPAKWQTIFAEYKENIASLTCWNCTSISWIYKNNSKISQNSKKFYANGSNFYYIKKWDTKQVYTHFVIALYEFLHCKINKEYFSTILDADVKAEDILKDYFSIRTNEFIREMSKYFSEYVEYNGPKMKTNIEPDDEIDGTTDYAQKQTNDYPQEDNEKSISADKYGDDRLGMENALTENIEQTTNKEPLRQENSKSSQKEGLPENSVTSEFDKNAIRPNDKNDALIDENENNRLGNGGSQYIENTANATGHKPIEVIPQTAHQVARPFTEEEIDRMRSHSNPLELESLSATTDELNILTRNGISPEQIADTNYLAQLRLYHNLQNELGEEPEENLSDFIHNAGKVSEHRLKSGKYIHACSAASGVMYISPSIWNKMLDEKCIICVYLNGMGTNFHYIQTVENFLELVEKDDVVIKITGKEKVDVINKLYREILKDVRGTAYTLIRVASKTNIDAVFAHYVGAMAEKEDGNDNLDVF